ncbi:dihydrofolate reductase family protein [Kitasatospora sp. A2-31]|uniref:dihydrofolate reductase family protein n=1 Tax=Kitasatospora sp. A2-31 TaxID=2916414 RepID=UPI001EEE545B|nr:hypothetical protein [Kitasatospora sp. A2-31]MCG6499336.1 hypothetical protein [Kitasatospora sp. A2-31]
MRLLVKAGRRTALLLPLTLEVLRLPGPARAALGVTAYPHLRHYVFSRSLTGSPDAAAEVVSTDPLAKVRELKAHDGKGIWLVGGGELAGALYRRSTNSSSKSTRSSSAQASRSSRGRSRRIREPSR